MQHNHVSSPILCIETSGSLCGVALADATSRVLLAELSFFEPFLHDKLLAEATRSLLAMTGIKFSSLAAVAVSAGPGSFTGLRIGAAFAKALAFDNTPQLIAVPTLQSIALASAPVAVAMGKKRVCVGIPSHKHLIYAQNFSLDTTPQGTIELLDETLITPDANTFYAGAAFAQPAFAANLGFTSFSEFCRITPSMIAQSAMMLFQKQAFTPAEDFVPLYAQEFVPKSLPKLDS